MTYKPPIVRKGCEEFIKTQLWDFTVEVSNIYDYLIENVWVVFIKEINEDLLSDLDSVFWQEVILSSQLNKEKTPYLGGIYANCIGSLIKNIFEEKADNFLNKNSEKVSNIPDFSNNVYKFIDEIIEWDMSSFISNLTINNKTIKTIEDIKIEYDNLEKTLASKFNH